MKKIALFLFAGLFLASCSDHTSDAIDGTQDAILDKEAIKANAQNVFGNIDTNQNWSSIKQGAVTITPLNGVSKVQILTEPPVGQANPTILNEATVQNNEEKVTLVFDAPNVYDVLFAACVDNNGKYFVKAFSTGEKEVSFTESAAASRMTRGDENTYPSLSAIVLGDPAKSFNALRAEEAKELGYTVYYDQTGNKGSKRRHTEWNNGSWLNDYLWSPVNATSNGWQIKDGAIQKAVDDSEDLTTIQWLVKYYLPKTDGEIVTGNGNKTNNWKSLVEGTNYFKEFKNHFVSSGEPLTIIPLQMNTTEGAYNTIYYYYFDPVKNADKLKDDQKLAEFIKSLPKFKALHGYKGDDGKYHRDTQYLLPYYGDNAITAGATPQSLSIPAGYYIGFLNQKAKGESTTECLNGCTYGYGPLNIENNHIFGHYFSALSTDISMESVKENGNKLETQTKNGSTPYGMTWDSPRIGIFSANNKAYLCFEDGADCNFSDMIIEISSGIVIEEEPVKPAAASYIMCFEDEPETADYDMNDVVLLGERLNDTQIKITLLACGAYDKLEIKDLLNSKIFGGKEIHKFFSVTPGEKFINTKKGEPYMTPTSQNYEIFNIDKTVSVEDFMSKITVKNQTTGKTIGMPKAGEAPYAIIIPLNFRYPQEQCCITIAYPKFKQWAQNRNEATDWYLHGEEFWLYKEAPADAE